MAYSIVNHEQSMRLFAARSVWDMRMSVVVAGVLLIGITWLNLMMGIMGRALYPTVDSLPVGESLRTTADPVYPVLVRDFTAVGLKGIVVAGLLAAAVSTYAGMSAAMSALLTRDVYARLIARDRPDRHYVRVGRWMTLAVALGSFFYVPFLLRRGMMSFYLELVGTFVVPLLTVYLMGVFTRVHRKSGTIGLVVGMIYGIWRMVASQVATTYGVGLLPAPMLDSFAAYPFSMAITAGAMLAVSLLVGFERRGPLVHLETTGWLQRTQQGVPLSDAARSPASSNVLPALLGLLVVGLGLVLSFVVFW
jgi:SSS family solute:Na+ symporter